jgi:hypothetical protein
MAQTPEGAIKALANKAGIPLSVFLENILKGLKWCYQCKTFHPIADFGKDSSRYDGLTPLCAKARNDRQRRTYVPVPPEQIKYGPNPYAPRDGDKKQARQRINVLVRTKKIPHPQTLPCTDCGHIWVKGERRHEYDHYLGYAAEHHYHVQPVCSKCHASREVKRGCWGNRKRNRSGRFTKR